MELKQITMLQRPRRI